MQRVAAFCACMQVNAGIGKIAWLKIVDIGLVENLYRNHNA